VRHPLKKIAAMLIFCAALARAESPKNETGRFVGPESDWPRVRVELKDVHGLHGGHAIAIEGSGRAVVQLVEKDRTEYRFNVPLDRKDALALVRLVAEQDLLAAKPLERAGVPDEARVTLIVRNAQGLAREVTKWAKDPLPAFQKVEQALVALKKRTEGKPVDATVRHDPSWRPFEGVTATVSMYSGRPDPTFELTSDDDLAKVKALLVDLPETKRPVEGAPGLGYRGILLNPRGVAGLPNWITVYKGTVTLGDSPDALAWKKDAKGLEAWLTAEAKKRGIEIPK
jgi:hypothetical protein